MQADGSGRFRRLRRRALHGLLGGAAAGALVLPAASSSSLRVAELKSYDLRARLVADPALADTSIVIAAIDDRSLREMAPALGRWPWPRDAHAAAVEFLRMSGARAVVFDVTFPEPDLANLAGDSAFAGAVADHGAVVLPFVLGPGSSSSAPTPDSSLTRFALPSADASRLPEMRRAEAPMPLLAGSAAAAGSIRYMGDDADPMARRAELAVRFGGAAYPSLALATARLLEPARFGGPVSADGRTVRVGRIEIPVDDEGGVLLRWRGPFIDGARQTYPVYSYAGIVGGYLAEMRGEPHPISPEVFRGRTVLVAATAAGLLDLRATPVDGQAPGVMIHATLLDNLLRGDWLRRAPWAADAALTLVTALLVGLLVGLVPSAARATAAASVVLLAAAGTVIGAFHAGVWMAMAAPLLAGGLAFAGTMAANYATEGRDKQRVREMFSRYVSPEYVRRLADEHESLRLGGQRVPVTVLFSDIRGFTSLSERLPPETVVEMLNEYLEAMSDVVFRHGGTLDKFIGDAVMAFWNAPIPAADHPRRAVAAAVEMLDELARLNARWTAAGRPAGVEIGIGIHTGEAIVGNIGSLRHKLDYTAIGDTVNLASRLEGLNKERGTRIIVSDATRAAVGEEFETREMEVVSVKGRELPVQIHEVVGRRASSGRPGAAASAAALAVALLLGAGAGEAAAQKARWTDQVYRPGRWQGGQVVPHATTNAATDTLALVARVDAYSQPPRWRAEIRRVGADGRTGEPTILLAERGQVMVLTNVSTTPLAQHAAGSDPLVRAVAARFDAQGRPGDRGAARLVDRAAGRAVSYVTVRRPLVQQDFDGQLLATGRGRRIGGNLLRAAAQVAGSQRSEEVVATAGARGVARVQTVDGVVEVQPDSAAVRRMESSSSTVVAVDEFRRQGRLGKALPVKESPVAEGTR